MAQERREMTGKFNMGRRLYGVVFFVCLAVLRIAGAVASDGAGNPAFEVFRYGGPFDDGIHNIRQTADGGYLLVGTGVNPRGDRDMAVYRVDAQLQIDLEFGVNGLFSLGGSSDDQAVDAIELVDKEGRSSGFLVLGQVGAGAGLGNALDYRGGVDLCLIRLRMDGSLDPRFQNGGIRLIGGSEDDEAIVHRDNFSEPGNRITKVGDAFIIAAMTRSNDGDLAELPVVGSASGRDGFIFAVDPDGEFVRGFGENGRIRIGTEPGLQKKQKKGNDFIFSIAGLGREGFFVSGYTAGKEVKTGSFTVASRGNCDGQGANENEDDIYAYKMDGWILAFDGQGRLRDDWGNDGILFIGGIRQEKMYQVAIADTDHLFAVGRTSSFDLDFARRPGTTCDTFDAFAVRVTGKGKLDGAFGVGGSVVLSGSGDDQARRVIPRPLGGCLVAGYTDSTDGTFARPDLSRKDRDGFIIAVDKGGGIKQRVLFGGSGDDSPVAVIENERGEIIVAGITDSAEGSFAGSQSKGGDDIFILRLELLKRQPTFPEMSGRPR